MSSVPAELSSSLSDFRTKFVPIGDFLRTTMIGDAKAAAAAEKEKEKTARCSSLPRAECLLRELQEEMRRIDHAKIQLPLCMLLLNDAMMVVKESVKREKPVLVLEEFIPLKKDEECKGEDDGGEERMVKAERDSCKDKKSWMSSVQLWSSDDTRQKVNKKVDRCGNEDAFSASTKNWTPLSLPIKNVAKLSSSTKEEIRREDDLTAPSLSLQTPGMKNLSDQESGSVGSQVTSSAPNSQSSSHKGGPILPLQPCRKQRRCWSPELHRRFVNALQQLGGSQAATPKQIREIMQVDGLTNDEVKSHLQKYRLHTRRMAPAGTAPGNQSLVVLGGLWMSQEQYAESSKAASSQSGSPPGPLEFGTTLMDEEDEEEDDAKSENYGWKSLAPRSGV